MQIKPQLSTQHCKDSLVSSVVLVRGHEGGEEVAHEADAIHHGHVVDTQQWPPLLQHLLGALHRKIAANIQCSNISTVLCMDACMCVCVLFCLCLCNVVQRFSVFVRKLVNKYEKLATKLQNYKFLPYLPRTVIYTKNKKTSLN